VAAGGTVKPLADIEREYVLAVLDLNEGNRKRTSDQLQISSATLYRKLKSWA
jgi:DNA-binding NtrC family response regulator